MGLVFDGDARRKIEAVAAVPGGVATGAFKERLESKSGSINAERRVDSTSALSRSSVTARKRVSQTRKISSTTLSPRV
jgi:hypothetical protein